MPLRHYFVETPADEVAVGYDTLMERQREFRVHSQITARPESERGESDGTPPNQPGVHADSRSDDNITEEFPDSVQGGSPAGSGAPRKPARLLLTKWSRKWGMARR